MDPLPVRSELVYFEIVSAARLVWFRREWDFVLVIGKPDVGGNDVRIPFPRPTTFDITSSYRNFGFAAIAKLFERVSPNKAMFQYWMAAIVGKHSGTASLQGRVSGNCTLHESCLRFPFRIHSAAWSSACVVEDEAVDIC